MKDQLTDKQVVQKVWLKFQSMKNAGSVHSMKEFVETEKLSVNSRTLYNVIHPRYRFNSPKIILILRRYLTGHYQPANQGAQK